MHVDYENEIITLRLSWILALEAEAQKLEDEGQKDRSASVRQEIERIKKAKADYVAAHPEHAKLVYPGGRPPWEGREPGPSVPRPAAASRSLFGPNGLPLHPERSIYYDAVLNPFGVPPPGMPYVERRVFKPSPRPRAYLMAKVPAPLPHEIPPEEQIKPTVDSSDDSEGYTRVFRPSLRYVD